jgi:hypothetical protein
MGGCGERAALGPLRRETVDGDREGGKDENEGWRCSDTGWAALGPLGRCASTSGIMSMFSMGPQC